MNSEPRFIDRSPSTGEIPLRRGTVRRIVRSPASSAQQTGRESIFDSATAAACRTSHPADLRLRAKAVCCLLLVLTVIAAGLFAKLEIRPKTSAPQPIALPPETRLPGGAVQIPVVPVPAAAVAQTLTIFLRAAPNCPAPDRATGEAQRLAAAGVKRVILQCKQDESDEHEGGSIFFPGTVAPVAVGFEDARLIIFATALREASIEVAAWVPIFNDAAAALLHPDWRARSYSKEAGVADRESFLCPRHPAVLTHEGAIVRAAVEAGGGVFSAVYLDFIRFDDDFSCVCERCLAATAKGAHRDHVAAAELPAALASESRLWKAWTASRGDAIQAAADAMRAAIVPIAPNLWLGACVLPFSARSYALNTQSGQDLRKLCKAGLDEIMLMGYWDDWDLSPHWLAESCEAAAKTTRGETKLTCVIDGDMSIARTMSTLAALGGEVAAPAYFHYGVWADETIAGLHRAISQLAARRGGMRAEFTAVCIRIDTEPDFRKSYTSVKPAMIRRLLQLFAEETVLATFATCGRLAELQPEVIHEAVAQGHEIAVHAYDHEQIDELPEPQQLAVIDHSLGVFRKMGIPIWGFAAPRNSISDAARDRLIEHGLLWDGSRAFDPREAWVNAEPVGSTHDPRTGIVVVPFTMPNDWDARYLADLSAPQMAARWLENLRDAAESGDTTFVIDIHQWIAALDDNLAALRTFIRGAKAMPGCRIVTVRDAAIHVLNETRRADGLAWQWSEQPTPGPR